MGRKVTYGPKIAAIYETLLLNLRGLLEDKLFLDCCLFSGGQSIKCHRLILASVSPYFRVLLQTNKEATLVFDTVTFVNLKCMIEYIYNGSTQLLPEEVTGFEETLKYFQLDIGEVRSRASRSEGSGSVYNRSTTNKLSHPMSTSSDDSSSSDSDSSVDSIRTSQQLTRRRQRSLSFSPGDSWKSDLQFSNHNLFKLKPFDEDSTRSTNGRGNNQIASPQLISTNLLFRRGYVAQYASQANDNVETQNDTRGDEAGLNQIAPSADPAKRNCHRSAQMPRGQAMKTRRARGKDRRQPATFSNKFPQSQAQHLNLKSLIANFSERLYKHT